MAFALYYEARPFIEALDLKRDNAFEKFQLFKRRKGADGPEVLLFITGPGSINSAAAVAYICAKYPPGPEDFLVNTGICAGRTLAQKGQMYRIHTLCDLAANRWFYPDMFLISGTYPEESLATAPVPAKTMAGLPCTLADMEGAGVYQAAQMFFKQHQLLFFKAVFDLPDMDDTQGSGTLPEQVSNLLEKFASELLEALFKAHETCMSNMAGETAAFSEEEAAAERDFARRLRATAAMAGQLHQMLYYEKLKGTDVKQFLEDFSKKHGFDMCDSQKEGTKWLDRLRDEL